MSHADPPTLNAQPLLRCGAHVLDLARPRVMGILNVTPDSFSDGGAFLDRERALDHARSMLADGADIVDVGGESTRPRATPVDVAEELRRVVPIVGTLAAEGALVSIDPMKPAVMREAIAAGAVMVNDVRALQEPGALDVVAASGVAVCLMHMRGSPATMQDAPRYDDVVGEVRAFLIERAQACECAGIDRARIVVDPGFGFGKTAAHNFRLLHDLRALADAGYPVLVGLSRKASIGAVSGRAPGERAAASLGAALAAVARGASIVRVHNVRDTVDALAVWHAVDAAGSS
jgi:dihydropteroate synthase